MFCEPCRQTLNSLPHEPDSSPSPMLGALTTLLWPDELPEGRTYLRCGRSDCRQTFQNLLAARTGLWIQGAIPGDLLADWNESRIAAAGWPGFQRLSLDSASKRALESLLGDSLEVLRILTRKADRTELGEDGITHIFRVPEED